LERSRHPPTFYKKKVHPDFTEEGFEIKHKLKLTFNISSNNKPTINEKFYQKHEENLRLI